MRIDILYHITLNIREYVLLGVFTLGDEILNVYGVGDKFVELISDEEFILYGRHEL